MNFIRTEINFKKLLIINFDRNSDFNKCMRK